MNCAGHLRIRPGGTSHPACTCGRRAESLCWGWRLNIMHCSHAGVSLKMSWTSRYHIYQSNITLSITDSAQRSSEQTWSHTHPSAPASCRTRPERSAWRSSDWGFCFGPGRGFGPACRPRCEGSSSSGPPRPSWWTCRRRTRPPSRWACIWEKRSYSLLIWKASSRVWHMTSTDTWVTGRQSQLHLLQALQIKFSAPQIIIL